MTPVSRIHSRASPDRFQRLQVFGFGYGGGHQGDGLACRLFNCMHPAHLLANVGVLIQEGVHVPTFDRAAEGQLVEAGSAGSHDHSVDFAAFDILLDEQLARVRTHEHVGAGCDDAGDFPDFLGDPRHVHVVGDVAAAVANVNADPLGRSVFLSFSETIPILLVPAGTAWMALAFWKNCS